MPVAHHQSLSGPSEIRGELLPPVLSMNLFEHTIDFIDKAKMWQNSELDDSRKAESLRKGIETAQQIIAKAEERRDTLLKRNAFLKTSLEHKKSRQTHSLEYWKNYGLDVKQIPTEKEDCEEYEFIYSKLSKKPQEQVSDEDLSCSVCILHQGNNIQVTSQNPTLINEEQLGQLNSKLTDQCIETNGKVNYKSAMTLIKKALIENLSNYQQQLKFTSDSKPVGP